MTLRNVQQEDSIVQQWLQDCCDNVYRLYITLQLRHYNNAA